MSAEDQGSPVSLTERWRRSVPSGRAAAPLLPARARLPLAALAACCAALVIALGVLYAGQSRGAGIDQAVDGWVIGRHLSSGTLQAVSELGGLPGSTVLTAVLATGCLAVRRFGGAVLAVAGIVVASLLTEEVLKPVVHRTIGSNHYLTYPSGHTTGLFALSAALAVVLLGSRSGRPGLAVRITAAVLALLVSSIVGAAMIGLSYHYFTDAVAGAAVGTAVVIGIAFLLDLQAGRRWLGRFGR